ncbi:heterokaryon incompatibility protein-domain-containing protein [Hypoxylon sp. FL1857]|nr:heterokaryon incompatibility protein-domain-containing protein [Hypoxylon sp. FL1857]
MYLLNVKTYRLESTDVIGPTAYAILSHRWDSANEVLYQDMTGAEDEIEKKMRKKSGFAKVEGACKQAEKDGFGHIWIDTCCIDKSSSAELSEAINSMYKYYQDAQICYAYLASLPNDTDPRTDSAFADHEWFERGWTLQELIAPREVIFYTDASESGENNHHRQSDWIELGHKSMLCQRLSQITGIDEGILSHSDEIQSISIAKRMSWAARRKTTRIEDRAYSLLGLFDVNMPMIYGEGPKAFIRLQEEIMKHSSDESLFAWRDDNADPHTSAGLLANSPGMFRDSGEFFDYNEWEPRTPFFSTNRGVQITLHLRLVGVNEYVAALNCPQPSRTDGFVGIRLMKLTAFEGANHAGPHDQYVRVGTCRLLALGSVVDRGTPTTIYIRKTAKLSSSHTVHPEQVLQLRDGPGPEQGYRLHTTMGTKAKTALRVGNQSWIDANLTSAFEVTKKKNCLAAVVVFKRSDNTAFTILLGSGSHPGDVEVHILDEYDQDRNFGEWALMYKPQPCGFMELKHGHISVNVKWKVVYDTKYFLVDINLRVSRR